MAIVLGLNKYIENDFELVIGITVCYVDVIKLLGDLHILFNFLKAIGQHIESVGLDDIWVEAGSFA